MKFFHCYCKYVLIASIVLALVCALLETKLLMKHSEDGVLSFLM